ncbi:neurochondrin [Gouania willdenowi]|nr:neurochondrin [Gouania willdenowi]
MAENTDGNPARKQQSAEGGDDEGPGRRARGGGLSEAQAVVLERCIRALKEAKMDSQTLAALLLITRLCPASDLDKNTLRRIFEAVGFNLPARLLVTAFRQSDTGLSPHDVLSLATALLAALSADSEMVLHPQLLTSVPILLGLVSSGPMMAQNLLSADFSKPQSSSARNKAGAGRRHRSADGAEKKASKAEEESDLDEAMAGDIYQVLIAVSVFPKGVDHLLRRGAVYALCQAVEHNQTLCREKGLPLLATLLSGQFKDRVWSKHGDELITLLLRLTDEFCKASNEAKLELCTQIVQFLPPTGVAVEGELVKVVSCLWEALRPMVQSKLTPNQLGPVLVLCAALLDVYGWKLVGPPKFCCLLVNRACVEIRMALEEPLEGSLSAELQQTLAGCYRIMEAAIEEACRLNFSLVYGAPKVTIPALSEAQQKQILRVLQEAFAALMFYLGQVDTSCYGDPFVFATFRCLCCWLSNETSCLKEEVASLLPFLINYSRSHLLKESSGDDLSDWLANLSISEERESWAGRQPLRFLIPAVCHLTAEDRPRRVLLALDTPALLMDFLTQSWVALKRTDGAWARDTSMETVCAAFLNLIVLEPERVREDPCFKSLEAFLSEALPTLMFKPRLVVLAANFCTLGLVVGKVELASSGSLEPCQRRFFTTALRFLRGALDGSGKPGPVKVSANWAKSWDEAAELWRVSVQALGSRVSEQPSVIALIRGEGWLKRTLAMLDQCSALPDPKTEEVLEATLCSITETCPTCKEEVVEVLRNQRGALINMAKLKKAAGVE